MFIIGPYTSSSVPPVTSVPQSTACTSAIPQATGVNPFLIPDQSSVLRVGITTNIQWQPTSDNTVSLVLNPEESEDETIASAAIISWSTLEHSEWPWLTKQEIFQTLACLPGLLLMTVYSSARVVGFSPLSTTPPRKQANLMASTSCQQTTSTHLQVPILRLCLDRIILFIGPLARIRPYLSSLSKLFRTVPST